MGEGASSSVLCGKGGKSSDIQLARTKIARAVILVLGALSKVGRGAIRTWGPLADQYKNFQTCESSHTELDFGTGEALTT